MMASSVPSVPQPVATPDLPVASDDKKPVSETDSGKQPAGRKPSQGKKASGQPVSKSVIRRNQFVVWSIAYLAVVSAWIEGSKNQNSGPLLSVIQGSIIFVGIFALLAVIHHGLCRRSQKTGVRFGSAEADGHLMRRFMPRSVRSGRYLGISLCNYLRSVGHNEWIDGAIKAVLKEKCSRDNPLILRSHLLALPGMRENLISRLSENGMACEARDNIPVDEPVRAFILYWITPAVLVFQCYSPAMRSSEGEILVWPADSAV